MKPGEYLIDDGEIVINANRDPIDLIVTNTGDRPVQVGSHYHFSETNGALAVDRDKAVGRRLDIPAGTAGRFEPGQERDVTLVKFAGRRYVYGFNATVMGALEGASR